MTTEMPYRLDIETIVTEWIKWVLKAVFEFMFTQLTQAEE